MPSNTARGGGIVLPIVRSIAASLGSTPLNDPKPGSYLMLIGAHANLLSASMYLTGMAPNPIVLSKATKLFPDLKFDFTTWLIGSSVPALTCAILLPFLLYWLCGLYGKKDRIGKEVIEHAKKELSDMGSMSMKELVCVPFSFYIYLLITILATLFCSVDVLGFVGDIKLYQYGFYSSRLDRNCHLAPSKDD